MGRSDAHGKPQSILYPPENTEPMSDEIELLEVELDQSLEDSAAALRALAGLLETADDELTVAIGGESTTLPATEEDAELELEVTQEGDEFELEIDIEWEAAESEENEAGEDEDEDDEEGEDEDDEEGEDEE